MVFAQFFRRWSARPLNVNFIITDGDFFNETFDDFAFLVGCQRRPTVVKTVGFVSDVISGKLVYFQEIDFSLQFWQFRIELVQAFLGWLVELAESLRRDL